MQYDLRIEVASFIVISIIFLNLFWDRELDSRRNRLFKAIVYVAFSSILITLVSTYTADNVSRFPLWLTELLKVIYYILLPSGPVAAFLYSLSLQKTKTSTLALKKRYIILLLPFFLYTVSVLLNYFFNNYFSISPQVGYIRGALYLVPYPVTFFYTAGIFIVAIKNRKSTNSGIEFALCVNMVLVTSIALIQFFFSHLILSGLANITGVLVIYLYVQNVTKTTDSLTGLYNRDRLAYDLTKKTKKQKNERLEEQKFSLIVFSLRNMKSINERFGLANGNGLLEAVGRYFKNSFSPYSVYRYNGDEFAVLVNKKDDALNEHLEEVVKRFEDPFNSDEDDSEILLSVVYARVDFPDFGEDARALVTAVDYSIASLKKGISKSNYMHDISVFISMSRRNKIIERVKEAIKNDGFEVHYQAIHSTKEKKFTSAEALIRMKHNEVDPIYPSEFIPLAEETGLIVAITYIVIEKVCENLRFMLNTHGEGIGLKSVSVNFPYTQFLELDMVKKIVKILQKYDIPPRYIKIEITERALVDEAGPIRKILLGMQKQGFEFELDDFGVDYSNMSMVLKLPIEIIKIDRSLVLVATAEESNKNFFKLFIKALKEKKRILVVEGVEKKEHVDFFEGCGCEYIQGFFYAKPLKFNDFLDFLMYNK